MSMKLYKKPSSVVSVRFFFSCMQRYMYIVSQHNFSREYMYREKTM